MLIYATIFVDDLSLSYDSSPQIINIVKSKSEYKKLYDDIKKNGVLDPILVNQYPDRLQVETGGQRLLLARCFNIKYLKAFVYAKQSAKMSIEDPEYIQSIDQLKSKFRSLDIATYLDIEGYIKSGHIQLDTDS